ncbi:hypothetical protein VTN02DRAFT_1093 [Thermoascus thermophilus]
MAILKYLLPALAASHIAFAAKSDNCDGTDTPITIQNQGDASALASCETIEGDVEISEHVTGGIALDGVKEITGSLTAIGAANMSSLTANDLQTIGKSFELSGLITLTTLGFGSLSEVGEINWAALPNLQALSFGTGVSKAGSVSITNTGLTSLDGISLDTVGNLDVTANPSLSEVNVNGIRNCTGLLNFAANNEKLKISLPNLETGRNMTFRNTSSVSIPSLKSLTGQLGLFGNTFEDFAAPNLTTVGDLVFDSNENLKNISLPQLVTVNGGFQIAKNDELKEIDGIPKLQTITGALDFSGVFDTVDVPSLEQVKGGFNMQSKGEFSCDPYQKLYQDGVIKGTYKCKPNLPNPTTKDGSSGTTDSTSSAAATTSTGAAVQNLANVPVMGLAAVLGGLLQLAM